MPQFLRFSLVLSFVIASAELSLFAAGRTPDDANNAGARVVVHATELHDFDWAKLQAQARVAYVSSGPRSRTDRMIDNDLETAFRFGTSDESPTVIIELARTARLHRVSAVFMGDNATVAVYLFNELPKNPTDLRFATQTATIVDPPDSNGKVSVNFSVSSARYVALRWIRRKSQDPIQVAEISAFSNDPTLSGDGTVIAQSGPNFSTPEPPPIPLVSP
jgi:hypothetical protein